MKNLSRSVLLCAALSGSALADEPGWKHYMSSGDTRAVAATLTSRPRTLLRTDGVQVPGFTPEDGVRIAVALREAGITDDRILAQHLLGVTAPENIARGRAEQSSGPAGRSCPLTLDIAGTRIKVRLEGGYVPYVIDPETMQRVRRFSVDDALRIKAALNADAYGDAEVMQVWLGLVVPNSEPSVEVSMYHSFAISADPLNPPCNQCQDGRNCSGECCVGSPANCTVCTVCP